ncbi:MAG: hypothetical protein SGPRY_001707, partial [Prymnesium sp.]
MQTDEQTVKRQKTHDLHLQLHSLARGAASEKGGRREALQRIGPPICEADRLHDLRGLPLAQLAPDRVEVRDVGRDGEVLQLDERGQQRRAVPPRATERGSAAAGAARLRLGREDAHRRRARFRRLREGIKEGRGGH